MSDPNITHRIEAFRDMARLSHEKFEERRKVEWKVNFGIGTIYIATAGAIITSFPEITANLKSVIIAILFILAVLHTYWLFAIHSRNRINKEIQHFYQHKLNEELGIVFNQDVKDAKDAAGKFYFCQYWSIIPVGIVSFSLAGIVTVLLLGLEHKAESTTIPVKIKTPVIQLKVEPE